MTQIKNWRKLALHSLVRKICTLSTFFLSTTWNRKEKLRHVNMILSSVVVKVRYGVVERPLW